MFDKNNILALLNDIADKLEFLKENPYRISAFRNGADALRKSSRDIEKLIKDKKLSEIKGIGKGLESVIYEYYSEGYSTVYNELLVEVPEGIEKLLKIKGLTPKRIRLLYDKLGIKNLEDLERSCREDQVCTVDGFDKEFQGEILKQIDTLKENSRFVLLSTGYRYKSLVEERLADLKSVTKYSITDQMRRGVEIVSSVSFVLLVPDKKKFEKEIAKVYDIEKTADGYILPGRYEVPIVFHLVKSEQDFIKTLFLTTGSKSFIQKLTENNNEIIGSTEEDIFKSYRAPNIIPEMREEQYFDLKKGLRKNSDLISDKFKGLLHFHSTYSDGKETLENMLNAAAERGFKYAAICDHSKFAYYANGLSEDRILMQIKELNKLKSKIKLVLFQGIETDILKDGKLDYDSDFMSNFDFVVASIHKRFDLSEKEMTGRIIKAVEDPNTDLLGHPSGRFLLQRAPYAFDVKKVIDACAANDVAIEINSNPKRLDLDWRWIYYAREKGCLFSVNPDAHSIPEINFINFGIKMARKGGIQSSEVINCFELNKFKKFLNRKIKRDFKIV